jgi:hypothetical protein
MNVSQGRDVNEAVFEKLDQIDLKKMGKQIQKFYPEVVKRAFPKDKILTASEAVTHLCKVTRLDEGVIRNCLSELIDKKDIIPSRDTRERLHLSLMKKLN